MMPLSIIKMERVFKNEKGTAYLDRGIFTNKELLKECINDVKDKLLERPEIIIYGKICKQQRSVGFFSDNSCGYNYSNQIMQSTPLTPSLTNLITTINELLGADYNGILINKYSDGNDTIGAHSDSQIGLDPAGVVSISYGCERIFRIRNKIDKKIVHEELTTHGSILVMGGDFQKHYTHEIPKQKKIKEERISFTFRKHI